MDNFMFETHLRLQACEDIAGQFHQVPGIAGYEWVPARIGHFYKDKIFFHNTNGQ